MSNHFAIKPTDESHFAYVDQNQLNAHDENSTCESQQCAIGTEIKFRAEAELDALLFIYALPGLVQEPWTMVSEFGAPDVSFRLKGRISIDELRWVASVIPDAHTIVQTIATAENYSGIRNLELQIDVTDPLNLPAPGVLAKVAQQTARFARFSKVLAISSKSLASEFSKIYKSAGYAEELQKSK